MTDATTPQSSPSPPSPPSGAASLEQPPTEADASALQRRTLRVLMASVALGGAGTAAGFGSISILVEEISGSDSLGEYVASGFAVGTAGAAIPLAKLMERKGRRIGLRSGYLAASAGGLLAVLGSVFNLWGLAAAGIIGVGVGNASGFAARFAAVDLVRPERHARNIGMLIWSTTLGAVAGPAIALGPAADLAVRLGLRDMVGTYLFIALAFIGAALICGRLKPDPLLTARRIVGFGAPKQKRPTLRYSLRQIRQTPGAITAVSAMSAGHFVMIAVMVTAPLHMLEGDQGLRLIGFVESVHVLGMFAFSPLVGMACERFGVRPTIVAGSLISFAGAEIAAYTPSASSLGMFIGLGLVGLGWSFCLISGSSLLTSVISANDKVGVQGAADLLMNGAGVLSGFAAGAIVGWQGFGFMSRYIGIATVAVGVIVLGGILLKKFGGATPTA